MGQKGWCWFLVVAAWVGSPLYHSKGTCCVFGDLSGVLWPPLAGGRSGLGMIDKHVVVVFTLAELVARASTCRSFPLGLSGTGWCGGVKERKK